jgi:hypothetical protein
MRDKAIPALTMIVAAGLIGLAQARLPRPIRDDRVNVEMSAISRSDAKRRLAQGPFRSDAGRADAA